MYAQRDIVHERDEWSTAITFQYKRKNTWNINT